MKPFLLALMTFLVADTGSACQNTFNAQELEEALDERDEMKVAAAKLAEQADRIFIGTVETISKTSATFWDIVPLKGLGSEKITVEWTDPEELLIGCGGLVFFQRLEVPQRGEDGELRAYLVYASGDRLLRANEVGSFADAPSGYEELEWLMHSQHITNHSSRSRDKRAPAE